MHIQKLTAVSASVTWKPLSKSSLNGKLIKYVVTRKANNGNGLKLFDAIEEKIDFTDLRPFTRYIVQVATCNSAGCGPKSEEIIFTTDEAGITNLWCQKCFLRNDHFYTHMQGSKGKVIGFVSVYVCIMYIIISSM